MESEALGHEQHRMRRDGWWIQQTVAPGVAARFPLPSCWTRLVLLVRERRNAAELSYTAL